MNQLSDEELFRLFKDGQKTAFDKLVLRYKDKLYTFIYMIVNDVDLAEDLTQDTYLKVYTKKDSYNETSAKFSTWMYTIAKNAAFTELRKKKRRKTNSISEISKISDDENRTIEIPDPSMEDLEAEVMNDYMRKSYHSAISQLKQDFQTIIILRDIQELSYDAISIILEVPIGTVKSRINRARLKLLELIKEKGII